jgi:hypothetical protein
VNLGKKIKVIRLIAAGLCALLAAAFLSACGQRTSSSISKQPDGSQFDFAGNYFQPELTVDGKDDETEWKNAPVLTMFGRSGYAVSVKALRGERAVFF